MRSLRKRIADARRESHEAEASHLATMYEWRDVQGQMAVLRRVRQENGWSTTIVSIFGDHA